MKHTTTLTLFLALALVGSNLSFQVRLFNTIITNESALEQSASSYTGKATSFPSMPCVALDQESYKLFTYYPAQNSSKQGYTYTLKDGRQVVFNVCTSPDNIPKGCPKGSAFGYVVDSSENCWPMFTTGKDTFDFQVTTKKKGSEDILTTEFHPVYKADSKEHKGQDLGFNFVFDCLTKDSKSTADPIITEKTDKTGSKYLEIRFHQFGYCGVDAQKFLIFIKNNYFLSGLFIIISLPLIFLGLKFIKKSLAAIGFLAGLVAFAFVVSTFTNFMIWSTTDWVIFSAAALVFSILVAIASYNSPTLAVMVAGCLLGYLSGTKAIQIVASLFKVSPTDMVTGITIGVFICLGFLLAYKLRNHVIIWATSFGGAQLFTFGLGSILNNYPDFTTISQQAKANHWEDISTVAWSYIGGSILLCLFGAIFQYKKYMKDADKKEEAGQYGDFNEAAKNNTGGNDYY